MQISSTLEGGEVVYSGRFAPDLSWIMVQNLVAIRLCPTVLTSLHFYDWFGWITAFLRDVKNIAVAWLRGENVSLMPLLGLRFLWFGRMGKLAEYVGGLTVILDIIGPERLRVWCKGVTSRRMARSKRAKEFIELANEVAFETFVGVLLSAATNKYNSNKMEPKWKKYDDDVASLGKGARLVHAIKFISMVSWAYIYIRLFLGHWKDFEGLETALGGLGAVIMLLMPLVTLLLFVLYWILVLVWTIGIAAVILGLTWAPLWLAAALTVAIIQPIADLLDRPRSEQRVKVVGVAMVACGFLFDLISS